MHQIPTSQVYSSTTNYEHNMAAGRRLLSSVSPATVGFAAAAGAGLIAFNMSRSSASPSQPQKSLGQKPVFPAIGFVNLTLEEARMVSHDTKELKFKLPGGDATSGLTPVCKFSRLENYLSAAEQDMVLTTTSFSFDSPYRTWLMVPNNPPLYSHQYSGFTIYHSPGQAIP